MHVKVLLATSTKWISTARLAMAFAETGCEVHALCRPGHPLLRTSIPVRRYRFHDLRPMEWLERAIHESQAELLVPCDEETLRLAHELFRTAVGSKHKELCALLERSLGAAENYKIHQSRFGLMQMASTMGIPVPDTEQVETAADLRGIGERLRWPLVLKTDGSSGGNGVRMAEDVEHAAILWRWLRGPAGAARTLHRVLASRRLAPLYATLRRERLTVIAQRLVAGKEATMAVACWKGKVLATHCMEVVQTWSLRGPSSVLRVVERDAMRTAAESLVRRLGLSGFCGFDFILDEATGEAMLIEMNSRPTQTSHLALGTGKDLVAALVRAIHRDLGLRSVPDGREAATDRDVVVLFPQELQRDPGSDWIRQGFHDMPVSEPALVRFALSHPGSNWYSRAVQRFSKNRRGP